MVCMNWNWRDDNVCISHQFDYYNRSDGTEETNMYTKDELDEMIYNWKTKRPPSRIGGAWVSTTDTSPWYGVLICFLLAAMVGPMLILYRKFLLICRDDREIQDGDGDLDSEILFPDPHSLPSDPKLMPPPESKEFAVMYT